MVRGQLAERQTGLYLCVLSVLCGEALTFRIRSPNATTNTTSITTKGAWRASCARSGV
jgi:hypothetical protein